MYKTSSIRVRTAPPVSVRVRVSVSFSFTILCFASPILNVSQFMYHALHPMFVCVYFRKIFLGGLSWDTTDGWYSVH